MLFAVYRYVIISLLLPLMIASIKGIVTSIDISSIIVDVHDVGYKVSVPNSIISSVHTGDTVKVFTHTHVRDDIFDLYGFLQAADLKLFEKLISVSGVGPKTALGIFSLGSSGQITEAVQKGDTSFFSGVPRLGKKNAQKIILELRGKLDLQEDVVSETGRDVVSALVQFGFSEKEAFDAVRALEDRGKTTEEKIKLALKYLGK